MSKKSQKKFQTNEWIGRLILMGVGVIVISAAWKTVVGWALGLPFVLGPLFESPEFRFIFKVSINKATGKEVFQIGQIKNSTIFQGGTHYHEAPSSRQNRSQRESEEEKEPDWEVDESIELNYGEYEEYPIELKRGSRLVGTVEASEKVTLFLVGDGSLRSFKDNLGFNYYWGRENGTTRAKVSYKATETRTHHLVVSYGFEDEGSDSSDSVSVEIKLRVE